MIFQKVHENQYSVILQRYHVGSRVKNERMSHPLYAFKQSSVIISMMQLDSNCMTNMIITFVIISITNKYHALDCLLIMIRCGTIRVFTI